MKLLLLLYVNLRNEIYLVTDMATQAWHAHRSRYQVWCRSNELSLMFFPVSNFHFVVVRSISSRWRTRAFLMFGLIEMGGWGVGGGGGKNDIFMKWHCIASWNPPSMCVWKPYFDNLSIQVLEDVVMTLCFAGCRYQAPDCTNHWFRDVCTQNITNTSSRKTFPFSCCPQKLIWSYTVCM